jgi:cytochrome c-type biogenesis protein CcmE
VDPARKRKLRFAIALSCALLLASALIYTSFSASSEARTPSQLATAAKPGRVYELTGKVQPGSISSNGTTHRFRVRDLRKQGATFVGQRDTLVTKCPSKFSAEKKT